MANPYEFDARGPSGNQLFGTGVAVLAVVALITAMLLVKATGRLDRHVEVVADLVNVGDGLPQRSDVKYHGVLVGVVQSVTPAAHGDPNFVHIDLDPEYATSIPATVTARVVPSNVFAVSSVQLVDPDEGSSIFAPPIGAGAHIPEDTELPTVLFQTTISKLRDILAATGRGREDKTIGILAAINAATEDRRSELLTSGAQLNRLIDEVDSIVSTDPESTTVSALVEATQGLQRSAPELIDALHVAVEPMRTLVEQRSQLDSLIAGGLHTMATTDTALNNHADRMVKISSELTPVLGSLADTSHHWNPAFVKLNQLSEKFFNEVWLPELDAFNFRANLSFTPTYNYTRADCPQYAGLQGPSCFTAPLVPTRPELPDVMVPQNFQPPPDLFPPPGTAVGESGNLIAVGPPLINPNPTVNDPNPPLPQWMTPSPPVPGTANPALEPAPQPPAPLSPVAPVAPRPGDLAPASAPLTSEDVPVSYGGNVGPVGSQQERRQIGVITGQPASTATQLLLGPMARGTTVSLAEPAATRETP